MKKLLFPIFLMLLSSLVSQALAQEEGIMQVDSTAQVVADSTEAAPDTIELTSPLISPVPPVPCDTLLSERETEYEILLARYDSLKQVNEALAIRARRRLGMDLFVDSFRQYHFYSCAVDPEKIEMQLFNPAGRRKLHTFSSISKLASERDKQLLFAMNAGMYERDRSAKGLFITQGKVFRPLDTLSAGYGNFYMQPNGVFVLDSSHHAYVVTTEAYQLLADSVAVAYATQSGPMMLVDGEMNPLFNDGSPNRHIRNAVGVTPDNEVVFAISARPVTFFELSSFLLDQGCVDALYLDGAISQMYAPELGLQNLEAGNHLGPIIAIWKDLPLTP